ncbi:Fe-S cluster assembly protein SufD [Flammeovirga kamogawensis]|uniref:Fe-S cluster assembly protein SufD n=1 Tax=Flammeovirga kamogawensis TaxID=373891 RepID=A0ABX8GVX3_9BACT|nr:Fe-S cluster assembly protein SufD [Flammeovirga kamogawensis]MBB6461110.1 Fe-S cluster assembly protein SufD [Flammeovirga kamogawensis]QWG07676.1 Fe-S cluster assembly protein SufD [Flammeovirga kamogawensis]TRX69486.1 Fe-S cluster assembly protein SufD [Flammeovirga kamogawensis]
MSIVIENAALKNNALAYIEDTIEAVPALVELRTAAAEKFASTDFPSINHEEWKYTNLKKLVSSTFNFNASASVTAEDLEKYLIDGTDVLVFVNGIFNNNLSKYTSTDKVIVAPLAKAINEHTDLVTAHLGKYADSDLPFVGVNTAAITDGVFVYAKRNALSETPVTILNVIIGENTVVQPRLLAVLEEGAQVSIIERNAVIGNQNVLINSVSEINVAERAILNHVKLQDEEDNTNLVTLTEAKQADNSVYHNITITTGGQLVRNNLNIALGEHCEGLMTGLYLLKGKTLVDNHTVVDHRMPNSYSNELYKGILSEKSKAVFNGKIFVREDAQKTNAFQSNKNILLSPDAVVNTKPQLEIWADDVSCSHGCTVGALDEEPMFYLRARGISEDKARALLTYAFAGDVIEKISNESVRSIVERIVANEMGYPLD